MKSLMELCSQHSKLPYQFKNYPPCYGLLYYSPTLRATLPQEGRLPLQVWHPISLTRLVSLLSSAPFPYFVRWSQHGSGIAHKVIYFRAIVQGSKSSTGFYNNSKNVSSTRENFVPKHFIFLPHLLLTNLFSLFVFTVEKKHTKSRPQNVSSSELYPFKFTQKDC